ncbi:MAG: hypothetical protein JSR43_12250 [Proteobacteria bacterium]|nr:hypothetical protein [Pseudomonadota bacterium]
MVSEQQAYARIDGTRPGWGSETEKSYGAAGACAAMNARHKRWEKTTWHEPGSA